MDKYDNQNDLSLLNEAGYNNIGDCIVEDKMNENSHHDMATQSQKKVKTDKLTS